MAFSLLKQLPRAAVIILLAGLLLRVAFVLVHQRPLISDERDYHQLAVALLNTGTYGYDHLPTAYRPIAYPLLIAGVYGVVGEHPLAIRLLQAVIDCTTALLLFFLVRDASPKARLSTLAAWIFYLPAVLYTNFLLSESVFTFLLVAAIFFLERGALRRGLSATLVGLLLGVLTLMKPAMFLFLIAVSVVMPLMAAPLRRYKFVVLGALLVIGPWVVRNYFSLGKATLATNGGINLLIGNNPNATGAYNSSFPEEALKDAQSEVTADEKAYQYALDYIVEHPGRFVLNGLKKVAHLFSSEGGLLVWSFHPHPEDFNERYAVKYASVPLPVIVLVNLPYITLLLLGIVGLLNARMDTLWWLVICLFVCWIATHFIFFGGSRFHFPLMPFLALYAAPVALNVRETITLLSPAKKVVLFVLVVGLVSVWTAEFSTLFYALGSL